MFLIIMFIIHQDLLHRSRVSSAELEPKYSEDLQADQLEAWTSSLEREL